MKDESVCVKEIKKNPNQKNPNKPCSWHSLLQKTLFLLLFELGLGSCVKIAGYFFCRLPVSWICQLPPQFQPTRPSSSFLWTESLFTSPPSSIRFPPGPCWRCARRVCVWSQEGMRSKQRENQRAVEIPIPNRRLD